jgi:uncharacterized protein
VIASIVFIDVNVFMYAAGASHPFKVPCVRILSDIETGVLVAVINTEILQELLYRYIHIKLADKGIQLCRDVLKYPLTVLPVVENDIRLAIDLFQTHQVTGIKPRDAIHAATMQNNGITRLISADADFDRLSSVIRVDPLAY